LKHAIFSSSDVQRGPRPATEDWGHFGGIREKMARDAPKTQIVEKISQKSANWPED
jgi:hypothetical protein